MIYPEGFDPQEGGILKPNYGLPRTCRAFDEILQWGIRASGVPLGEGRSSRIEIERTERATQHSLMIGRSGSISMESGNCCLRYFMNTVKTKILGNHEYRFMKE